MSCNIQTSCIIVILSSRSILFIIYFQLVRDRGSGASDGQDQGKDLWMTV